MPGTYANLLYHVVFSTKRREPMIHGQLENELHKYIIGIAKGEGAQVLALNGTGDHLHIVLRLKTSHVIPSLMRKIKANSSKWVNDHRKVDGYFSWQAGYGIFTISESQAPKVISYVKNQKAHHQHTTFESEFEGLLEKHQVEYDSKYLWEPG